MKKSRFMEIIGVLSVSLIVTSSLGISGTLPFMLEYFNTYPRSSVETLVSVPAAAMTVIIALSPILTKKLPERLLICTGLTAIGVFGMIPFYTGSYWVILLSRALLGVGIGLVNTRAVSMIGERFTGNLRSRLQGIRVSAETLGQTALTLIAGQLLVFGWKYAFLIYLSAFVILFLYAAFVPADPEAALEEKKPDTRGSKNKGMSGRERTLTLLLALLGGLFVSTTVANSLRIPAYIVELRAGTAVLGTRILSLSMFSGLLGGLCFGKLLKEIKIWLLPCSLLGTAAGLVIIGTAKEALLIGTGAVLCGFFLTCGLSFVFNRLAEQISRTSLNTANAAVLVGCNLGASASPYILKLIGTVNTGVPAGFITYGILYIAIGAAAAAWNLWKNNRKSALI